MKENGIGKVFNYRPFVGILIALTSPVSNANMMPMVNQAMPSNLYVGIFGGYGNADKIDVSQYGTAFYPEALGGPLAVNAFGETSTERLSFLGLQVGYQWNQLIFSQFGLNVALTPAFELEGYYFGRRTYNSHLVNLEATRLPEHDFIVGYPTRTRVFLTNAVLNFNSVRWYGLQPYIGVGIGGAVLSISGASALQISPPEPGINHYNENPSDRSSAFAGQIKVGVNFCLYENLSAFIEYRWLYIASTDYYFGSTVYPGHFVTSNWLVKLEHQQNNLGAIGIRYNI